MSDIILGISAYYHDSAVCIVRNGEIIAAAQEERFSRIKHDKNFPAHALAYAMDTLDEHPSNVSHIAFYDKPLLKLERLLETYHAFAPAGLRSFYASIPVWLREKMLIKANIRKELRKYGLEKRPILFPEHHLSHASSAFYPSPYQEAAILTIDGVGEWTTTAISQGKGNSITLLRELRFPHSLGLLYSSFTYYCGFKVNSGEYKLMGLAPYGEENGVETRQFKEKILSELIDVRPDGSFLLNMKYFNYATGLTMTHNKRWSELFGIPPRQPDTPLTSAYCNMALSIQQVIEEIVLKLAETARELTGLNHLVMAGGVALNSVASGKLQRSGLFKNIWIQPASGDAGGALGAALATCHIFLNRERKPGHDQPDSMKGAFLGPEYSDKEIVKTLSKYQAPFHYEEVFSLLCQKVAAYLDQGKVVGWFRDRMEFGPRALGNRSILADARNKEMQKRLNLKIKFRESFRPFAPAILAEDTQEFFQSPNNSPYMLFVAPVADSRRNPIPDNHHNHSLAEKLYWQRSDIPAVTHVDYSARLQTVDRDTNPAFHQLISEFKALTGYPVLINTSFNVRGEPIVCTPEDAFICFMRTDMDILVINNFLLYKNEQMDVRRFPVFQMINIPD